MTGAAHDDLPEVLREIAALAGRDAAVKLAQAKGGTRIYVPRKVDIGHWLAKLIGLDAAYMVRNLYAGEIIAIPLGASGSRHNAQATARQALDDGASVAQAARAAGLTERTVYRLMGREERVRAAGQGDLFDL